MTALTRGETRLPQLDGIRGIAILLVLVWHYAVCLLPIALGPLGLTWSGVDLFFVLSGFLIGGILLDHRDSINYFRVFYIRRFCRILPLYWAWLGLFALVSGFFLDRALFASPFPALSYLTFTQNVAAALATSHGPMWLEGTWSLAVEEQFYLLLPAVVRMLKPRLFPYACLTAVSLAPVLRMAAFWIDPLRADFANYVLLPTRADALLLGVFGAWLLRQHSAQNWIRSHRRLLHFLFVALFSGVLGLGWLSPVIQMMALNAFGYTWLALFYICLIVLAVSFPDGSIASLTSLRPLRWLGTLAYGIYLIHEAMNWAAHATILDSSPRLQSLPDIGVTLLALVLTLALASFSWNRFEKPILALGHRVQYTRVTASECQPGEAAASLTSEP